MTISTYEVTGMTCGHCVNAVTQELLAVPTVTSVDVDLASGSVTIDSEQLLDVNAVRAAVDEAGYELVG